MMINSIMQEFNKNKITDVRELLCEKYDYKYDNIEKVFLIVPEKYRFETHHKWIIFNEYCDNIMITEQKDMEIKHI